MTNPIDIIPFVDLTSLNDDDTDTIILALCKKAQTPYGNVAAVCVYPKFVSLAAHSLKNTTIRIATVVNFPSGDFELDETLSLIKMAISDGANEIDLVFPYKTYLNGEKNKALAFVTQAKMLCGNSIKLKVIIESGQLPSTEMIKEISREAIQAGADFIKTSTGKTSPGATLEAAEAILTAIKQQNNAAAGLKVSGGIRTISQAMTYIEITQKIMGPHWMQPQFFRIGASSLLDELCQQR